MKNKVTIILIMFLLTVNYVFGQTINYVYNDKQVSKNFIISGKSSIKIVNPKSILEQVKTNKHYIDFCLKYKDSLNLEIVSSLMIFKVNNKSVTNTNTLNTTFELNNIVNEFINNIFRKMKFKNLNKNKYLIGFYIHYIPKTNKTKIEFIEFKNNKYYSIYKESN